MEDLHELHRMTTTLLEVTKNAVSVLQKFKQLKKDRESKLGYEILSFIAKDGTITYPVNEGNKYFLSDIQCGIHSVKRLIDNEIFTIGDKTNVGNISCIGLEDKSIFVNTDCNMSFRYSISVLNKEPKQVKQVLFRTEDNVPIYKGDEYWYLYPQWIIGHVSNAGSEMTGAIATFSTKETAANYILMNKPLLSVNDMLGHVTNPTIYHEIKELAKSKL